MIYISTVQCYDGLPECTYQGLTYRPMMSTLAYEVYIDFSHFPDESSQSLMGKNNVILGSSVVLPCLPCYRAIVCVSGCIIKLIALMNDNSLERPCIPL